MKMKVTYRERSAGLVFLTFREVDGDHSFQQTMPDKEAEPYLMGSKWDVVIKKTLVKPEGVPT
ncbi:MAG: hypothetical protein V3V24_09865 [Nitrospinaceae bacterium]